MIEIVDGVYTFFNVTRNKYLVCTTKEDRLGRHDVILRGDESVAGHFYNWKVTVNGDFFILTSPDLNINLSMIYAGSQNDSRAVASIDFPDVSPTAQLLASNIAGGITIKSANDPIYLGGIDQDSYGYAFFVPNQHEIWSLEPSI